LRFLKLWAISLLGHVSPGRPMNKAQIDNDSRSMKLVLERTVKYLKLSILCVTISTIGIWTGQKSLAWKYELEEKLIFLQRENERLASDIKVLERSLTLVRSDPKTIEKVAKHKLGVARPDETVYVFRRGDSPSLKATDPEYSLDNHHNMP
jgi:cell division protein FtsB